MCTLPNHRGSVHTSTSNRLSGPASNPAFAQIVIDPHLSSIHLNDYETLRFCVGYSEPSTLFRLANFRYFFRRIAKWLPWFERCCGAFRKIHVFHYLIEELLHCLVLERKTNIQI